MPYYFGKQFKNFMRLMFSHYSRFYSIAKLRCAVRVALIASLTMLAALLPSVHAEPLEKALEAYDFQEYQDAAQWLRPWAEKGHVEAQYRLGTLYENGNGVDKSMNEARKWYQKAVGQGHDRARRRLDAIEGKTSKPGNESVALKWYQDLADQGDADAQYNLGFIYETGFSIPKDNGKAVRWYESAAEKKNTPAQLRLGMMYLSGAGVRQSDIQAEKWLGAAAQSGNGLAKALVQMLLRASPDMALNKPEIAERLRVLSLKDEKKALGELTSVVQVARNKLESEKLEREALLAKRKGIRSASDHETGIEFGLDAQGRRTIRWYQRNAERGVAMAQFRLGKYYEIGDEAPMDMKTAVRWYRSAAEQGFSDAQFYLGMLHYYGIGVERNEVLGQSLVKAAASQGHEEARRALERVKTGESPERRSMAAWWLTREGQEADSEALRHAGAMFEQGRGVRFNISEAQRYYQAAATLGGPSSSSRAGKERDLNESANATPSVSIDVPKSPKSAGINPDARRDVDMEADSGSAVLGSQWLRFGLFAMVAILPIGAFGWFVAKEKKRLSQQSSQKVKKARVIQRGPANPFK